MLSNSNTCQLMPPCPSGGLCGWGGPAPPPRQQSICHIFQRLLEQRKKRVRVEPSGRCAKPHWEVVAASWPRRGWRCGTRRFEGHPAPAHPLPPLPSPSDGQPDLAPKARVRRGRKTGGPVAIPCGEESPNQLLRRACPHGTPATLKLRGLQPLF